jgi:hypothetical protein
MKNQRNLAYLLLFFLLAISCSKTDDPTIIKRTEKEITSFKMSVQGQEVVAIISVIDKKISAVLPIGSDVKAIAPTITISDKATISPQSGVAQDFTNPVKYTVKAEDGTTVEYTVTMTQPSKCFLIKQATILKSSNTNELTSIVSDYTFVSDRVSTVSTLTNGNGGSTTELNTYTYNQNGTIAKSESANYYNNYIYNSDNKLIKIEGYNKQGDILSYTSNFEYNTSGQVIKLSYSAGSLIFEYPNNSAKNASKVKSYNSKDVLDFLFEYEYDDKKNPDRDNGLDSPLSSENNITKISQQNFSNNTTTNTVITYEYNTNGYPTKLIKTTQGSSTETTTTYTYDCK